MHGPWFISTLQGNTSLRVAGDLTLGVGPDGELEFAPCSGGHFIRLTQPTDEPGADIDVERICGSVLVDGERLKTRQCLHASAILTVGGSDFSLAPLNAVLPEPAEHRPYAHGTAPAPRAVSSHGESSPTSPQARSRRSLAWLNHRVVLSASALLFLAVGAVALSRTAMTEPALAPGEPPVLRPGEIVARQDSFELPRIAFALTAPRAPGVEFSPSVARPDLAHIEVERLPAPKTIKTQDVPATLEHLPLETRTHKEDTLAQPIPPLAEPAPTSAEIFASAQHALHTGDLRQSRQLLAQIANSDARAGALLEQLDYIAAEIHRD